MSSLCKTTMELTLVCRECGGGLKFRNKSAYTDENSFGIQVEPCSQCCEEQVKVEQDKCPHDNWQVKSNELGSCTCLDCNEQFPICDAFLQLRDRMLVFEAMERAKYQTADLTPPRPATPDMKNYPDESEVV